MENIKTIIMDTQSKADLALECLKIARTLVQNTTTTYDNLSRVASTNSVNKSKELLSIAKDMLDFCLKEE